MTDDTTEASRRIATLEKIIPGHKPEFMAEVIVTRLALDGGWDPIYKHLHNSGMNLRDLREERGF